MKFMNKPIKSYKAFDENLRCRGFQYEVGKEYDMNGDIKCCKRGFHACESPIEVWDYYDMLTSRFAEVEQSGKISTEADSTKICSSHIKIKAELKLADIINIGVEWLKNLTSPSKIKVDSAALNDGGFDKKQIGSSGDSAQIGSWITLAEWDRDDIKGCLVPVCVKTERVDGIKIKPDTWYELKNGEFVEVTE